MPRRRLIYTKHYRRRCAQRGFPPDCAEVALRHGVGRPGRSSDITVYRISVLQALRKRACGLRLWRYVDIAVPIAEGRRAVTAFHMDDADERRRWLWAEVA